MHPKNLSIQDFAYELPDEKIAQYPLSIRDQSKLLVYKNGEIQDAQFSQLPSLLPKDSLLVFNNTKVIHARILFHKETGAQIEIFCLEPYGKSSHIDAFGSTELSNWTCMIGNAKKWKGEKLLKQLQIQEQQVSLFAEQKLDENGQSYVQFTWDQPNINFADLLYHAGLLPIPPYLNRAAEAEDENQYQTVYAKEDGSVAAPTAGLHFTPNVFENLTNQNIHTTELTLHVGAGTFKPVKAETMGNHEMHKEFVSISLQSLKQLQQQIISDKPIVSVGTTSLRTLESIYWFGVKIITQNNLESNLLINQWDPYELDGSITPLHAISELILWMQERDLEILNGHTQLLIAPGYSFKIADAIITNFHQPNSTLLLLIASFVGDNWRKIYQHALANNYRFLSFGDSSLLFKTCVR